MQASFDDSGNGDASIMCVAGYFFRDDALAPLRDAWRSLLKGRRFHMVDLVHRRGDFTDLDKRECDRIARGLIAAIKQNMTLGIAVSVECAAYERCIVEGDHDDDMRDMRTHIGSPYTLCAKLCLAYSARWMEQEEIPPEETLYFFESGNGNQAEANRFMESISKSPQMDERYRYVHHGSVKKNKLSSLDAADLLGWEWTQQCKRISGTEHRPVRASLKSLCEKPHILKHYGGDVRVAFAHALMEPFVVPGAGRDHRIFRKRGPDSLT